MKAEYIKKSQEARDNQDKYLKAVKQGHESAGEAGQLKKQIREQEELLR